MKFHIYQLLVDQRWTKTAEGLKTLSLTLSWDTWDIAHLPCKSSSNDLASAFVVHPLVSCTLHHNFLKSNRSTDIRESCFYWLSQHATFNEHVSIMMRPNRPWLYNHSGYCHYARVSQQFCSVPWGHIQSKTVPQQAQQVRAKLFLSKLNKPPSLLQSRFQRSPQDQLKLYGSNLPLFLHFPHNH